MWAALAVRRAAGAGACASLRHGPPLLRHLSSSASAYDVLGLPIGSSSSDVKKRYYQLAKETHPDTMPAATEVDEATSADSLKRFLAVQGAFEVLMEELKHANKAQPTSKNAAARGSGTRPSRAGSAPRPGERPLSLAEILCQRLDDEPGVDGVLRIWAEIMEQRLQVTERVANALFRECAAEMPPSGKRGFFDEGTGPSAAEGAAAKPGIQTALEVRRRVLAQSGACSQCPRAHLARIAALTSRVVVALASSLAHTAPCAGTPCRLCATARGKASSHLAAHVSRAYAS